MKDARENTNSMEINRFAYKLATIAYFHNREIVDQCILYNEDLPTDELEQVEMILERANEPEHVVEPEPEPMPRRRFDYDRYYQIVPL